MSRPRGHKREALGNGKTHSACWIRQLLELGLMYQIVVLELTTEAVLNEREIWWIAFARAWGCPLTNLTNGGDGNNGWVPTTEVRNRISATLNSSEKNAQFRAILRAAQARPEAKEKHRAAWARPGHRELHCAAIREALARPEAKEKYREIWSRPGMKERHSIATSKATRLALARPEVRERRRVGRTRPDVIARHRGALLRRDTVASLYRCLISQNTLNNAEMFARVVERFGVDRAGSPKQAAWYRWKIRRQVREVAFDVQWGPM